MQKVLSAEEMRRVDRLTTETYGIPAVLLMENAAHAAARVIAAKLGGSVGGKSFIILCGKGNNGGDGAAVGRVLWTQGAKVHACLFGKVEETTGEANLNFEILKKLFEQSDSSFFELEKPEYLLSVLDDIFQKSAPPIVIVDAVFGTGLRRKLDDDYEKLAKAVDNLKSTAGGSGALIVSLDIPSGLNSDSAELLGENIKADLTVTFTAPKIANVLPPASNFNGEIVVANIGSPQVLIDDSPSQLFLAEKRDARDWLDQTKFTAASYKNARGRLLIVAGSRNMSGAAVLAANAAMVSGIGLLRVAVPRSALDAVAARSSPETMVTGVAETKNGAVSQSALEEVLKLAGKSDAAAIGCGLSSDERSTRDFVREFVEKRKFPVVIDADGLNALAPFDLQGSEEFPLILTPHQGEMLNLLGTKNKEALKDRVAVARNFAQKHNVILVFKGERALVAAPDGRVVVSPTGNSGLGKAGNGDTLAGIIGGFVAQAVPMKIDIFETVIAALYIAGLAGDLAAAKFGRRSMLATDVRECLSEAFRVIEDGE